MQVACYSLETDPVYVNDTDMNFVNANIIFLGGEPGPYAQRQMHSPLPVGACLYSLVQTFLCILNHIFIIEL